MKRSRLAVAFLSVAMVGSLGLFDAARANDPSGTSDPVTRLTEAQQLEVMQHELLTSLKNGAPEVTVEDLREQAAVPKPASRVPAQSGMAKASTERCDEAWGDGPELGPGGYLDYAWVEMSRFQACSKVSITGGSMGLQGYVVVVPAETIVTTAKQSKVVQVKTTLGRPAIVGAGQSGQMQDTLTIKLNCVQSLPEVACSTSDPDGVTHTLAEWEGETLYMTVDYSASPGLGVSNVSHSALYLNASLTTPLGTTPFERPWVHLMLPVRCDSASYLAVSLACVMTDWTPEIVFGQSINHLNATAHIRDALYFPGRTTSPSDAPLPGRADLFQPLTRNFLGNRDRRKITAACKQFFPFRPPNDGLECDEYPFSTSYQNVNYSPFFSVRPIPSGDNQSAGGTLTQFYAAERLIDGDPFYVDVAGDPSEAIVDVNIETGRKGYCDVPEPDDWVPGQDGVNWVEDDDDPGNFYCINGIRVDIEVPGYNPAWYSPVMEWDVWIEKNGLIDETLASGEADCSQGPCSADIPEDVQDDLAQLSFMPVEDGSGLAWYSLCGRGTITTTVGYEHSVSNCLLLNPSRFGPI